MKLVTSLLSCTLLRFCVGESFVLKVFGSNYRPYFTWERAEGFPRFLEGIIRLFSVVFLSNCSLATCHSSVTNRQYRIFLKEVDKAYKRVLRNSLEQNFCWKVSSVKSSAQKRECFKVVKHPLFISISHSP